MRRAIQDILSSEQAVYGAATPQVAVTPAEPPITEMPPVPGLLPEGPVDSDLYRVGPGDHLRLVIWGAAELMYELPVGPEGHVFIPNVGIENVGGLTLNEVRTHVREAVLGVFREVRVDLLLAAMRQFKVHVVGEVQSPGSYPASAVTRVSEVIELAGGLAPGASSRRIMLRSGESEPQLVDLVGFETTGELSRNPYVTDGAVVEVPRKVYSVAFSGALVHPGTYEPIPGERLSELLRVLGGLRPSADVNRITLTRFVADTLADRLVFAYRPGDGRESDPVLEDGDRVLVPSIPDWHRVSMIHVEGAVRFRGLYSIPTDGILLSEAIRMAGGFTERANLVQAHVLRRRQEWTPQPNLKGARGYSFDRAAYEMALFNSSLDSVFVAADFVALFEKGDTSRDLTLVDGDIVQVPENRNEVRVLGTVKFPGSYPYQAGADVRAYIRDAGGFDKDADKKRTQLALFEGGPLRHIGRGEEVPPGAVLWVPAKERLSWWQRTREVAGLAVQVASLVVVIDRLVRD